MPRSAVAKRCSFRLIFKKNAPVLCKLGSVLTAEQDLQDVTENEKAQLLLLFHLKAVHLEAVSNVMHCYDDKDDFGLALRVALAEVQRGS